jgi:hypothetical protein
MKKMFLVALMAMGASGVFATGKPAKKKARIKQGDRVCCTVTITTDNGQVSSHESCVNNITGSTISVCTMAYLIAIKKIKS